MSLNIRLGQHGSILVFAFSACESIEVPAVGLQVDVHRHPLGGGVHAYTYECMYFTHRTKITAARLCNIRKHMQLRAWYHL